MLSEAATKVDKLEQQSANKATKDVLQELQKYRS